MVIRSIVLIYREYTETKFCRHEKVWQLLLWLNRIHFFQIKFSGFGTNNNVLSKIHIANAMNYINHQQSWKIYLEWWKTLIEKDNRVLWTNFIHDASGDGVVWCEEDTASDDGFGSSPNHRTWGCDCLDVSVDFFAKFVWRI